MKKPLLTFGEDKRLLVCLNYLPPHFSGSCFKRAISSSSLLYISCRTKTCLL